MIDSLAGEGWKNSQIVAHDDSQGGGLRSLLSGELRLHFRYTPEAHAIIVTALYEQTSPPPSSVPCGKIIRIADRSTSR